MHNVIVTGGSRGLGLGIVRRLTGAGYRAIAIARKETDQLASAMEEAERDNPGSLLFVPFDLGQIDDIPRAEMTLRFGAEESPNACLLCHSEKDARWVELKLQAW